MLSRLQAQLGGAHGLAIAAASVVATVVDRTVDPHLVHVLTGLRHDTEETRVRCLQAEQRLGQELASEILAHANKVDEKAADMLGAWIKAGTDPISIWAFLAMSEAAEVAAWSAVGVVASTSADDELHVLARWAVRVQRRHLRLAFAGTSRLARSLSPGAARLG
jgi:hypothetical protein